MTPALPVFGWDDMFEYGVVRIAVCRVVKDDKSGDWGRVCSSWLCVIELSLVPVGKD